MYTSKSKSSVWSRLSEVVSKKEAITTKKLLEDGSTAYFRNIIYFLIPVISLFNAVSSITYANIHYFRPSVHNNLWEISVKEGKNS